MVILVNSRNNARHRRELNEMHRERKRVFIDQLHWDVPCDGEYERDQFDDDEAEYLILSNTSSGRHLGSIRLLRTDRPHILGTLFPDLCDDDVPNSPAIREITRLCLSRQLKAGERQIVFHRLVTALTEYALVTGIEAYTAVTSMHWLSRTLALGWRCNPLGLPKAIAPNEMVAAMMIHISPGTIQMLREAGTYQHTGLHFSETDLAKAA